MNIAQGCHRLGKVREIEIVTKNREKSGGNIKKIGILNFVHNFFKLLLFQIIF